MFEGLRNGILEMCNGILIANIAVTSSSCAIGFRVGVPHIDFKRVFVIVKALVHYYSVPDAPPHRISGIGFRAELP